jgi:hypothetical protein
MYEIRENDTHKIFASEDFNYVFNKKTGYHAQWGKTKEENPMRSNYGPVIADIEVVSMCKGPGGKLCPFCYKSNTPNGHYMTFEDFKTIFHKLPRSLTQIAFGADADLSLNPDIFKMFDYCRTNNYNFVVPNVTVADISEETAIKLANVCGAVSVSWYGMHTKKDYCYDSIEKLTRNGLKQVNMHFMLSQESLPFIDELINDIKTDDRLKGLNAVVFLSLKQKGRGVKFNCCTTEEFKTVVERMLENEIGFGFDSCSAVKFQQSVVGHPREKDFIEMSESCESFSQSLYLNERGVVYPCSFMEKISWNHLDWDDSEGWDILSDEVKTPEDFLSKVWNSPRAINFSIEANRCASCDNGCQVYNI